MVGTTDPISVLDMDQLTTVMSGEAIMITDADVQVTLHWCPVTMVEEPGQVFLYFMAMNERCF